MDSGLGSDEERKGRTKEQKQLRNERLLSGCFIDAASLSDDGENERRQGALVFQSALRRCSGEAPATPFNSIAPEAAGRREPLGFYVDLGAVGGGGEAAAGPRKSIFSMVIDFEAAKKEKPRLAWRRGRRPAGGEGGSLSSSLSSVGSEARAPIEEAQVEVQAAKSEVKDELPPPESPKFVKLSDLDHSTPHIPLPYTPRMSRSIPESHWLESPLPMSRSATYRTAPHPLQPTPTLPPPPASPHPRRRLHTDLLRMFLDEIATDVTIELRPHPHPPKTPHSHPTHRLKAHKCILASRCQYFAALLTDPHLTTIPIDGFTHESVHFALCHIYSGAAHVPDSISLVELAHLADLLSLEGLKEVVERALEHRHCHNFHSPPCAGCTTGVLEVLPLAATHSLDDLYQQCLEWIRTHFVRVWPTRAFAHLPRELRDKCYQQLVVHLNAERLIDTIECCKRLNDVCRTYNDKWVGIVVQLVNQLDDACHLYHRQHFAEVLGAKSFRALDERWGEVGGVVETAVVGAAKNLGVEEACRSYARCWRLIERGNWGRAFGDLLERVKMVLEQELIAQSDRLIRSNAWLRLDSALRCRIKGLSPVVEPTSRLPKRVVKSPAKPVSSSESSRNSSPAQSASAKSPSLRRSLLLAAKAPQVPASPVLRKSTLTQPTKSSAAKLARSAPPAGGGGGAKPNYLRNVKAKVVTRSQSEKKVGDGAKVESRSSSPCKSVTRSRVETRRSVREVVKVEARKEVGKEVRRQQVGKEVRKEVRNGVRKEVKQEVKVEEVQEEVVEVIKPVMHRSCTFLKDEPTVMGKVVN